MQSLTARKQNLLDSPEPCELLQMLVQAQGIAERFGKERGRCLPEGLPLQRDEFRGTDMVEAISLLALRLRTEIHGPTGRE